MDLIDNRKFLGLALGLSAALLAGCGGGGGGGSTPAPGGGGGGGGSGTGPSSGIFALDVTMQGPSTAPTSGISLIHPSAADSEYVIEPPTAGVTDVVTVSSGTVDAAGGRISGIQPYAALYIVGGDVRRVPLVADGTAPATRVQKAGTTNACRFVIQADDYATPTQSRYIVSTAGADGACGTGDDGQAEVTLTTTGGVAVAPVTGAAHLGFVRSPLTLAPLAWVSSNAFDVMTPPQSLAVGSPITGFVASTNDLTILETRGGLSVFQAVRTTVPVFLETQLDPAVTTGSGWKLLGTDAGGIYLYRNSGATAGTSTWAVIGIARAGLGAVQLATGTGLITAASIGTGHLYVTESGVAATRVLALSKTVAGTPTVVRTLAAGVDAAMVTSSSGKNLLSIRPASGTAGYSVEVLDEAGTTLLPAVPGGYLLGQVEPTAIDVNLSENHSQFVFASGYGATGFSGAQLQTYDAAAGSSVILGNLPGASRFGTDPVAVRITSTPSFFLAGYAARDSGGVLQASDAVAFSFDVRSAGSLRLATTKP